MTLVHLALNLCSKKRKETRRDSSANLLGLGMCAPPRQGPAAQPWPGMLGTGVCPQHHKQKWGGGESCILDLSLMQRIDGHFQGAQGSRPSQSQELVARQMSKCLRAHTYAHTHGHAELHKHCQAVLCPHRVVLPCS